MLEKTNSFQKMSSSEQLSAQREWLSIVPVVLPLIQDKTGNSEMADEIMQDAMILFVKNRDSFRGSTEGELINWAKRIALRKMYDYLRSKRENAMTYTDDHFFFRL